MRLGRGVHIRILLLIWVAEFGLGLAGSLVTLGVSCVHDITGLDGGVLGWPADLLMRRSYGVEKRPG
jgi:hypothetical protein